MVSSTLSLLSFDTTTPYPPRAAATSSYGVRCMRYHNGLFYLEHFAHTVDLFIYKYRCFYTNIEKNSFQSNFRVKMLPQDRWRLCFRTWALAHERFETSKRRCQSQQSLTSISSLSPWHALLDIRCNFISGSALLQ